MVDGIAATVRVGVQAAFIERAQAVRRIEPHQSGHVQSVAISEEITSCHGIQTFAFKPRLRARRGLPNAMPIRCETMSCIFAAGCQSLQDRAIVVDCQQISLPALQPLRQEHPGVA